MQLKWYQYLHFEQQIHVNLYDVNLSYFDIIHDSFK